MPNSQKKSLLEMPKDWPLPDYYLLELGRIAATWSVLEGSLNIYIKKLLGINDPDDARPQIITTHMNFKQKQDAFGTLCDILKDSHPGLKDYQAVIAAMNKAAKARNIYVHGSLHYDTETANLLLSSVSARGSFKVTFVPTRGCKPEPRKIPSENVTRAVYGCFCYPTRFSVHVLAAQSNSFRLGDVAAGK
ncbi:hypothetical protein CFBP3840_P100115 (plasmid) [Pseudomonas syringae]|uniref:Uncharacterized protein n=1 Tax=Pseudomonas syringae TaxID=317 RepID=A0A2K4X3D9_PSESX|nr:hypothetical protein [Pseudomonas syringae]SOS42782.1 hypothetical protein CFBP3840_P100115 [Pseudomonas syringae]